MWSDPFAALAPPGFELLAVAWNQLRIGAPPLAYALNPREAHARDPRQRFARRTIAEIACETDRLALIDKVSPHSLYDLMVSEISEPPKATPTSVHPATGRLLWGLGCDFVRFVSTPAIMRRFELDAGELHLVINSDPHTQDRPSVQAAKQFHLHLLYWPGTALRALDTAQSLGEMSDHWLRRQALDPLSFLGAEVIHDSLQGFALELAGARLEPPDHQAVLAGTRPLGCLITLPGWAVLEDPAFESLVRRLHQHCDRLAADLLEIFTGRRETPLPWHRHPLRPIAEVEQALADYPLSRSARAGLVALARVLRDLPDAGAARLARIGTRRQVSLMTLNQPCYVLNLHAPVRNRLDTPLVEARRVHLTLQAKLFSGIGGAGLLTLAGIPSVRVIRGERRIPARDWQRRARFQRDFARFAREQRGRIEDVCFGPLRRFAGLTTGWI